ncbi:hypothetical protein ABZS99_48440 [Streptomyces sp. NPDC005463]|uniref:hypothetical protein n=1 Tax=Streptomyces sp. NPDC005463 TaxID=3154465 RepID=UPI0033A88CF9
MHVQLALKLYARIGFGAIECMRYVLAQGGRGGEIIVGFVAELEPPIPHPRDDQDSAAGAKPKRKGGERRGEDRGRRGGDRSIEAADQALRRQAEPELLNEILAGGAVAASFTAAATVAKAKIEATTQRRKDDLDAETERLRIASEERIAGVQARRPKTDEPDA